MGERAHAGKALFKPRSDISSRFGRPIASSGSAVRACAKQDDKLAGAGCCVYKNRFPANIIVATRLFHLESGRPGEGRHRSLQFVADEVPRCMCWKSGLRRLDDLSSQPCEHGKYLLFEKEHQHDGKGHYHQWHCRRGHHDPRRELCDVVNRRPAANVVMAPQYVESRSGKRLHGFPCHFADGMS